MSKSTSAGLLLFSQGSELRVLLAHPGGPYFAKKDEGAWSIPKGLVIDGEDLLTAAKREFVEETGYQLSATEAYRELGSVKLKSGKVVHGWAFEGEWEDGRQPDSNTFEIEWPPRSGRKQRYPEIDRAEMFCLDTAMTKINAQQQPFLDRLMDALK